MLKACAIFFIALGSDASAATQVMEVNPFLSTNFWQFCLILGGAFLGGMILNGMPCVLPVLALKFNAMSQPSRLSMRQQVLWLIMGVLFAFIWFALIVYGLQRLGYSVGWGFHFQQPLFVLFMMGLLLFFAFAQLGRVQLVGAASLQSAAHHGLGWFSPSHRRYHLFYGGVIVLLATPCTAPFLGSAVAFALTQPLPMIITIFVMIALGMSMPWVIFLLLPEKLTTLIKLSRQGRGFALIKNLSTALLYGSALWLLWVLSGQLGVEVALALFASLHIVLLLMPRLNVAAGLMIVALMAAPLFLPTHQRPALVLQPGDLIWHPFDLKMLQTQARSGKTVFVDITADWCLTCQYNKANVLFDKEVQQRLAKKDIYLMQGDLTNTNQTLTDFLKSQHRIGIPFNALYRREDKIIFNVILNKETLLTKLN